MSLNLNRYRDVLVLKLINQDATKGTCGAIIRYPDGREVTYHDGFHYSDFFPMGRVLAQMFYGSLRGAKQGGVLIEGAPWVAQDIKPTGRPFWCPVKNDWSR